MKIFIAIIIIFGIIFMFLFVAAYFIAMLFKRSREAEYQEAMIYLKEFIENNDVNRENFDHILTEFDKIFLNNRDMKYTRKLFVKFCFKYKPIWKEILGPEAEIKNTE